MYLLSGWFKWFAKCIECLVPSPLVNIYMHIYMYLCICMCVISFMNIFLFLRLGFSSLLSPPDGTMKQKRKLL